MKDELSATGETQEGHKNFLIADWSLFRAMDRVEEGAIVMYSGVHGICSFHSLLG